MPKKKTKSDCVLELNIRAKNKTMLIKKIMYMTSLLVDGYRQYEVDSNSFLLKYEKH